MKKYLLSIFVILCFIGVKGQKTIVNDANAEVRTLDGSFNKIIISGGIDLYLSQYDIESVAVSASSDQYKQNIKTVVENNTLKIYYDGPRQWNTGNKKMKAYVSFKDLEKLQASGACDVKVDGMIQVPALILNMSGASDFKGAVKVRSLVMELSGASDVTISGSATSVSIQSSGASDVKGYDLVTDVCKAKASGASDINITVNRELTAHASGASDIYYRGEAVITDMHTSGASSVVKKS
ncbi:MAG: head GIN domain-containing protein [Ferruginibacter sp.]